MRKIGYFIRSAISCMLMLAALFFFSGRQPAKAQDSLLPFYLVSIDIQKPGEQFLIDRTFYGNQAFVAVDIFDDDVSWTNGGSWAFNLVYAYSPFETQKYYIGQSSISSNRVYFLGATSILFSAYADYHVEVVGIHNSGYVKTFAQGTMREGYSIGADTNVLGALGSINLAWWTNNVGLLAQSNAARIATIESNYIGSIYVNGVLQNKTNTAAYLNVTTNGGSGSNYSLLPEGGFLSSTNQGTNGLLSVTLSTNAIRAGMSNIFLAVDTSAGGDVSGPYSNIQYAAGSISNVDVATNANIDAGKIRDVALTSTSTFSGAISGVATSLGIAESAVVSSNISPYTIAASDIATGAVTTAHILDGTISNADIQANAQIDATKIANTSLVQTTVFTGDVAGAYGALQLQTGVVGTAEITDGTILAADVQTNALDGSRITDGTVSNVDLAVNAVAGSNIVDGTVGTNDAALSQWDGRYLQNTGGTVSGRANLSGAAQGTNILTARNTSTPGAGIDVEINTSSTDYIQRWSRGSTVEYAMYPLWMDFGGNDLRNINAITGGWFVGDGAGVTNTDAETIDGIDSTNLTDLATFRLLNDSAVTETNPQAQRVLGDFNASSLGADLSIVAAGTNAAMSTNMIVNGDMALGSAYWTFGGGANSNAGNGGQMISAANTQGTAQQSNQFAATAGPWLLSYTNTATDATGSVMVSWGGVDRWQVGALTGYQWWIVSPRTTNGWAITVNATGSTAWAGKNFSLKQIKTGDVGGVYGSFTHLSASNLTVAGTISGNATGYLPLATGGVVQGPVTSEAVYATYIQNTFNLVSGSESVAIGGSNNVVAGDYGVVGGGKGNAASNNLYHTVGGGLNNRILATDQASTIGGGEANTADGYSATIAGGNDNAAYGSGATIGGGFGNAASNDYATVGGGTDNRAHGANSTIPGGYQNEATLTDAFAAGRKAKATNQGAFVWADGTDSNYSSHASHTFNIRANGGVWVSEAYVFDGAGRLIVNVATNPGGADGGALVKRGTNFGIEVLSASVTGVFDHAVTVTHSPTNYTGGTNLLVTLAGIDARLGAKIGTTNSSVTTAQIQDSAVTSQKMAAAVWNQIAAMGGGFTLTVGDSNGTTQVFLNDTATVTWGMDGTNGIEATAAGVNNVSHTGAVSGNLTFSNGTGVDVDQTNATFYWSVVPGAVAGIDGRTVTNAIPLNLGTGAVALASLDNVAQTGQVNSITYTGGTARGSITFSGSGVSQTGPVDFVFNASSGGTGTLYAVNNSYGPAITIEGSGVTTTGATINIAAGGGGGATGLVFITRAIVTTEVSQIVLTAIPQTFSALVVDGVARKTDSGSGSLTARCNGDSGNNYSYQYILGSAAVGTFDGASLTAFGLGIQAPGTSAGTNLYGSGRIIFHNYADASKAKTWTSTSFRPNDPTNSGGLAFVVSGSVWQNVSAITQLTFQANTATNIAPGTIINLYGVTY